MPSTAQPLKFGSGPGSKQNEEAQKPAAPSTNQATKTGGTNPRDISSPHELTAFVENLLNELDTKFDDVSSQMLEKMNQMSSRVDALEASIQDIINGDISVPTSPSPVPGTPTFGRRNDNSQY